MAILNFPPTAGEPTDGSFTYEDNGVLYSWDGYKWEANSESGFDSVYVEVAGDNMTGDLTLGTDKITLNATDGSGEFVAGVSALFFKSTNTDYNSILQGFNRVTNKFSSHLDANGNLSLGDDLTIVGGSTPTANYNIQLNADGSITAAGNTVIGTYPDQGMRLTNTGVIIADRKDRNVHVYLNRSSTPIGGVDAVPIGFSTGTYNGDTKIFNSEILADGSATFGGGNISLGAQGYSKFKRAVSGSIPAAEAAMLISSGKFAGTPIGDTYGIQVIPQGAALNTGCFLAATGDWYFSGSGNTRNMTLMLEADDDTKYTSTTNEDGEQTLVYNGAILDVKERLQKTDAALAALKSAAAAAVDFAALKSAIATALADI